MKTFGKLVVYAMLTAVFVVIFAILHALIRDQLINTIIREIAPYCSAPL